MHIMYIFHVALTFNKRSCQTITVAAKTLSEVSSDEEITNI